MATVHQPESVLVTGGCGFLGSHVVELLLKRFPGIKVAVMDLRVTSNTFDDVIYYAADLTSADDTRSVIRQCRPDVIIHTASPVFQTVNARTRALMYKVNVEGTKTLLGEAKKAGVKAFVYTSSASVVGNARNDLINADEQYLTIRGSLQHEYYSDTKAEAEGIVLDANTRPSPNIDSSEAMLTCAIRPSAMFGERDVQFMPPVLKALHDGNSRFQIGNNDNIYDTTYVVNAAHGHILAAMRLLETHAAVTAKIGSAVTSTEASAEEEEARVDGEAFFVTNDAPVYFWDFTRAVWAAYYHASGGRAPAPIAPSSVWVLSRGFATFIAIMAAWVTWALCLPAPKLDAARVRFSCMTRFFRVSKAQVLLGYSPIVPLDEAVARTTKYFAEQKWPELKGEEPKKTR